MYVTSYPAITLGGRWLIWSPDSSMFQIQPGKKLCSEREFTFVA